jgi:hypothetical protein
VTDQPVDSPSRTNRVTASEAGDRQGHEVAGQRVVADVHARVAGDVVARVPDHLGVVGEEADVQARKTLRPAVILDELPRRGVVERAEDEARAFQHGPRVALGQLFPGGFDLDADGR